LAILDYRIAYEDHQMLLDHTLIDTINAEVAVVATSGDIVATNRKWVATAGVGRLAEKRWNYFAECEHAVSRGCAEAGSVLSGLTAVLKGDSPSFTSTYSCRFDGFHHWFEAVISPAEIGGQRHAVVMHVDVSALQRDSLTGLANRAFFDAQLQYAIDNAAAKGHYTGLVIVDMDNLKPVNDRHGHQAGDLAIRSMADEIKQRAGAGSVVARIGGDEFGIVLPVLRDRLSVQRVLAGLIAPLSITIPVPQSRAVALSASCGGAVFPDDAASAAELYKSADRALYRRKRAFRVA
jgi:diguanylate cyclase (GGDEF)-like protein